MTIRDIIFENTCNDAVTITGGTNNKIAGCTIRNTGDAGVRIDGGTENGVISCDIYDTGSGGIYLNGGDRKTLTPAGNYATNNHIHHFSRLIKTYQSAVELTGVGNIMSHNHIHHAPHLCTNLEGNDHTIEFNEIHHVLFVNDCGIGWAQVEVAKGGSHRMHEKLKAVNYNKPPYSTRYPKLATILDKGDPAIPKGNVIVRNISYNGSWLWLTGGFDLSLVSVTENLIADPEIYDWTDVSRKKRIKSNYGDRDVMKMFEYNDNLVINTNPGFVDIDNENFELKEDSPAWKLGFKRIPVEKIGLYVDEYRKNNLIKHP